MRFMAAIAAAFLYMLIAAPVGFGVPGPRVSVFADVPDPGHPLGIAVHGGRVFVATSAGLPPAQFNTSGERVFVYTSTGKLVSSTRVDTGPVSNMGLYGLAVDGRRRLYVVDMNGRVLRSRLGPNPGALDVWAQSPQPYRAGGWYASMWNDIAFDRSGNTYVTDDKPRIWRISPRGEVSIWFEDPRLAGVGIVIAGPFGGQIGPDGKLYFAVTSSTLPNRVAEGIVYRLPLKRTPAPEDLEEYHRFPPLDGRAQFINGIAFGRSGRLYVAVNSLDQIAVLKPGGGEERRISSPLFHTPFGVAFLGTSLLVTNTDFTGAPGADDPESWKILKVPVGEPGLRPLKPTNIR